LKKYGFEIFIIDICCFINRNKDIFFYLYIDDIIIIILTKTLIVQTKKELADIFKIKELDEFRYYLNCRIDCNRKKRFIYIFQRDFIIRSLEYTTNRLTETNKGIMKEYIVMLKYF